MPGLPQTKRDDIERLAFDIHTKESAPEASRPQLEKVEQGFGMIPNLMGVLAESPETLEAYRELNRLFSGSSLKVEERHVLWLTANVENECHYCVPAHTMLALKDGVSEEIIYAIRERREIADPRLEAMRRFVTAMVTKRGRASGEDIRMFMEAGFDQRNILDVVLGISHKVISNYVNALADTPVDEAFRKYV